jgi:hypothetical protein
MPRAPHTHGSKRKITRLKRCPFNFPDPTALACYFALHLHCALSSLSPTNPARVSSLPYPPSNNSTWVHAKFVWGDDGFNPHRPDFITSPRLHPPRSRASLSSLAITSHSLQLCGPSSPFGSFSTGPELRTDGTRRNAQLFFCPLSPAHPNLVCLFFLLTTNNTRPGPPTQRRRLRSQF